MVQRGTKGFISNRILKDFFIVCLINCIFVEFKVLGMVKMNLKNVALLMSSAFLIILILALLGVDISKPVPYGGVILCCIVILSATAKCISSLNKKENEN